MPTTSATAAVSMFIAVTLNLLAITSRKNDHHDRAQKLSIGAVALSLVSVGLVLTQFNF